MLIIWLEKINQIDNLKYMSCKFDSRLIILIIISSMNLFAQQSFYESMFYNLNKIFIQIKIMSLSPQKNKILKESQIQRQIDFSSPTKNDINFYVRKTNRLENQLSVLQDQLGQAKLRLRKAEDYQIKYDLVLKQSNNFQVENQKLLKQIHKLKLQLDKQKNKSVQQFNKKFDFSKERDELINQIQVWKTKYNQTQQKRNQEILLTEKIPDQQSKTIKLLDSSASISIQSNHQYQKYKKEAVQRQERLETQIRQLKRILLEKQTVQNIVGAKVDRIRKQKDEQIKRLNGLIEKQKKEFDQILNQKKQQMEKIQTKFQKMFTYQIQNIKLNLDDQDQIFSIELNGLKQLINLKNQQIAKLLDTLKQQTNSHKQQVLLFNQEIKSLKEKLYKCERQNEIELFNIKQRLSKIHADDIIELQKKYNSYIQTLKQQKRESEQIVRLKQDDLDRQLKELDAFKENYRQKLRDKQNALNQLKQRLNQTLDNNEREVKGLHESFHKIQSEKEILASGYQQNMTFLAQQNKVLTSNVESKNKQIKYLQEELIFIKKSTAQAQKSLDQKWKQQRRQRQADREQYRVQKQNAQLEWETKQKVWRNRQKELEQQKQTQQRQRHRIQFVLQELQKDNTRLNGYIKQLDQALKRQIKKYQTATLDTGGIRRQMVGQLQKQKQQMQAMKKMEVDQIENQAQIQLTRLQNLNQKLQTDLLNKTIAFQNLEIEYKKLEGLNKNIERASKEKIIEYQRKMATLNSEINLTQNLYNNFMQVKNRMKKQKQNL